MSIFLILSIIFISTTTIVITLFLRNNKRIKQLKQNLHSKQESISEYEDKLVRDRKELDFVKNELLEARNDIKYYDYYLKQFENDIYNLSLIIHSQSKWINLLYQDNNIEETERILTQKSDAIKRLYENLQDFKESLNVDDNTINENISNDDNESKDNDDDKNQQKQSSNKPDINDVLEKINNEGMNSLSQDELDFLKKYNK